MVAGFPYGLRLDLKAQTGKIPVIDEDIDDAQRTILGDNFGFHSMDREEIPTPPKSGRPRVVDYLYGSGIEGPATHGALAHG